MKDLKLMSKKERKEVLITVSNEVQDLCEFEPAIKTDGKAEKDLIVTLKEAYEALTPEDKLSEEAVEVFKFLGLIKEVEDAEETSKKEDKKAKMEVVKEEEEADSLEEEIEVIKKMKDLKDYVKEHEDEFGDLENQLSGYTSVKSLKSYMIKILSGEIKKPKSKKSEKKESTKKATPKVNGGKKKDSVATVVRRLVCEKPDITMEKLCTTLEKRGFSDFSRTSVNIRKNEMTQAISIMKELGKLK